MKYKPRKEIYEASNVWYSPGNRHAVSYGWWTFVRTYNGITVFNDYTYSCTTRRHQSKVKRLMEELGHEVDIFVYTQHSLNRNLEDVLYDEIFRLGYLIETYKNKISTPRTRQKTKDDLAVVIKDMKKKITKLQRMRNKHLKSISVKQQQEQYGNGGIIL